MKVAANELTGADVQYISLVNRGANRQPFSIIKGAGDMIDLSKVFKNLGGKPAGPSVAFIATSKSIAPEVARKAIADAGFSVETEVEQEAGLVFVQPGHTADDKAVVYRVSDDLMIGVHTSKAEAIQKGYESYNWNSTDFQEVLGAAQTFPLFCIAKDALADVFYASLHKADNASEARESVSKALDDFRNHVLDILGNVPVTAFKLETALKDAQTAAAAEHLEPTQDAEPKGTDAVEKTAETTGEPAKPEDAADKVEKTEGGDEANIPEGAEASKVDKAEGKDDTKPGVSQDDATAGKKDTEKKSDETDFGAVMKAIEGIGTQVASLTETVTDVKKNVSGLTDDLAATKASLSKMDESLGGGLITGSDADDDQKTSTKKSDGGEDGFVHLDTAYTSDPYKD